MARCKSKYSDSTHYIRFILFNLNTFPNEVVHNVMFNKFITS